MSAEDSWSFGEGVAAGAAPEASPEEEPPEPLEGRLLGERFRVGSLLGQGGMATVYRAQDLLLGRPVALKLLRRASEERGERLRREGELTALLDHPGIVRVHSQGDVDGTPFLAYELIEGHRSFAAAMPELSRSERLRILEEVASAVGYAHAQGIVHRDLKAENVLLDGRGRPRVADFGLATAEGLARLTQSGALVGTPSHMAPEQLDPRRGAVGPATDVWALGVMLYRSLCDETPFWADSLLQLASAVVALDPRPPRAIDPGIAPQLEAVCLQALAKAPDQRYPDADAFASDLARANQGRAVQAQRLRRWRRWCERLPWAVPLLATAGLAVALVLALPAIGRAPAEQRLREALRRWQDGELARPELEARLAALSDELSPTSRARAHWALAEASRGPARLAHAEQAAHASSQTRDPELAAAAQRVLGEALGEAGQHRQAAAAFARAETAGDAAAGAEAVAALIAAGEGAAAAARCEVLLSGLGGGDPLARRRLLRLLVRAHLAEGALEAARAALRRFARAHPGAEAELLRAEWAAAAGEDPEPILQELIATWPERGDARLALAEERFLRRRDAAGAADALAGGPQEASLQARAGFLEGLLAFPPRVGDPETTPRSWRVGAARWLLEEARREVALRERLDDPRIPHEPGALSADARAARAAACLLAARACGATDARLQAGLHATEARLHPAESPGRAFALAAALRVWPELAEARWLRAEALLREGRAQAALDALGATRGEGPLGARLAGVRGRALVALGRGGEAREPLRAALGRLRLDAGLCQALAAAEEAAGDAGAAAALRARAERLRRPDRQEAARLVQRAYALRLEREVPADVVEETYVAALAVDPACLEAHYHLGKIRFARSEQPEDLERTFWALRQDPARMGHLARSLLNMGQSLSRTGRVGELLTRLAPSETHEGTFICAYLRAQSVELEGRRDWVPRALAELDGVLAREPGNLPALVVRAFLRIRARRLRSAARDLGLAREAAPACAPVLFYEALLRAARGDPAAQVRAALEALTQLKFPLWRDLLWKLALYPEMRPYLGRADFARFARRGPGRQ